MFMVVDKDGITEFDDYLTALQFSNGFGAIVRFDGGINRWLVVEFRSDSYFV